MNETATRYTTAKQLRQVNAELDRALVDAARAINPGRIHGRSEEGRWTAAQILAHLAEFPHYFAADLRRWAEDKEAPVGRTHENEARLAAVAEDTTAGRRVEDLLSAVEAAFADLGAALDCLKDGDLSTITQNIKYGAEPMTAFLDRYVIGHKASHLAQLRAAGGTT